MRLPPQRSDGGYATMAAIALCAAISVMCAALLSLTSSQRQQGQRELFRLQQAEAMNTAVLRLATRLARAQGTATLIGEEVIQAPVGRIRVTVRAEHEGRKWPLTAIGEVDETHLAAHTGLKRDDLASRAGTGEDPKDDCVRTLFSRYGANDPAKDFPATVSLIAMAGGHDGEVWRIRAITGGRVQERRVRFLGDPDHLFAVVSQDDYALGEIPTCTQLTNQP